MIFFHSRSNKKHERNCNPAFKFKLANYVCTQSSQLADFRHAPAAASCWFPESFNHSLSSLSTSFPFFKNRSTIPPLLASLCPWLVPERPRKLRHGKALAKPLQSALTNFTNRQSVPDHQITIPVRILDPYLAPLSPPPPLPFPSSPFPPSHSEVLINNAQASVDQLRIFDR